MGRRILYAEDEPDTRELLSEELRNLGYEVNTAADGEEAIGALSVATYDLVLLDIKMPRKTGLDVLAFMKENGLRPRIIMLTGADDLSIAIQSMKLGATDYVTKPFRFEELLASIERALKQ